MTRTYRKWDSMIGRCCRASHPSFKYYGGAGVKVCERWLDSFEAFLVDMGEAPPGMWLDRRDGTKGYEPGNCRWVTPKESACNRIQRQPDPGSLRSRAAAAGLPYIVVYLRVKRLGWTETEALAEPVRVKQA